METYRSTGRADRGDPHRWNIDLKWSAWTTDESIWEDYAPKTYQMLKDGFDGDFEEHGESMEIQTDPRKEARWMLVTMTPSRSGVNVHVLAAEQWDSIEDLLSGFDMGEGDGEYELMVDTLLSHDALGGDGEPGVILERNFVVAYAEDTLAYFLERVDEVESELIATSERAWQEVKAIVERKIPRDVPRTGIRRPRGARRPST
jgi:hypothetical protein